MAQKVADRLTPEEEGRYLDALRADRSILRDIINAPKRWIKRLSRFIADLFASPINESGNAAGGGGERQQPNYSPVARSLLGGLKVEPKFQTRIVAISYTATSPQVAALIANRFAEAYIDKSLEMMTDPAQRTKQWFDNQLKVLRAKYEEAQAKLTAYQQETGIVVTDERMDLEDSRLAQITQDHAAALSGPDRRA